MNLLILGGTQFLGRHLAEAALSRGDAVTLFNRGRTHPGLFPGVEELRGDRESDLSPLDGGRWDAVIDTSGYLPRIVRSSAERLKRSTELYVFISSISVYPDDAPAGTNEEAPVQVLADDSIEDIPTAYGALKARCEKVVESVFPGRALHVRSGLIVGPWDPTGRFTYWPLRIAEGGRVLAPGRPDQPTQFIDARDEAGWILSMAGRRQAGTYNVTGPLHRLTTGRLFEECRAATGSAAELTWVDEEFLLGEKVGPWMELPLWLPAAESGTMDVDISRARAAGLACRPLADTVRDTLAWARERQQAGEPVGRPGVGLARSREAELLAKWRRRG